MAPGDLITEGGQIEWGGVVLGAGTEFRWLNLAGWEDMPQLNRGAARRPAQHGSWPGRDYADERIIIWDGRIRTLPDQIDAAVAALELATPVYDGDDDLPLVIRTINGRTLLAYGRCTARLVPRNRMEAAGRQEITLHWTCSDPRRYSVTEHSTTIPQPDGGTGLTYPLDYPLDYGSGGDSGSRQIVNAGSAAASPIISITGPCTLPSVVNIGTGIRVELNLTLAAGETVVIDTRADTVLLGGADRSHELTARTPPLDLFTLPANSSSELAFRAQVFGGGAEAVITWRDAYQ